MVLVGEGVKFGISMIMLLASGETAAQLSQWDLVSSLQAAAAPALVYSVQNVLVQTAYPNISSLMFNLLNQTKTLSAAVFVYILMGKRQSLIQCLALGMLFTAAVMLSTGKSSSKDEEEKENDFLWGIVPVLGASALSGFASGLCQVTLQGKRRNSFVFTMELCIFSTISLLTGMAVKDPNAPRHARCSTASTATSTLSTCSRTRRSTRGCAGCPSRRRWSGWAC